jgi:hypothetical protein
MKTTKNNLATEVVLKAGIRKYYKIGIKLEQLKGNRKYPQGPTLEYQHCRYFFNAEVIFR